MPRRASVTFLGTGTSHGVPLVGCECATCRSTDPRDRRWRPSIAVRFEDGTTVLVDTSPDLRAQALAFGLRRADAIFFTHGHADHVLGLDEARRFNVLQGGPIPCYADRTTIDEVRRMFAYIFDPPAPGGGRLPQLALFALAGPFCLAREVIVPVPLLHGPRPIYGYRVGTFAYLTDCSAIPETSWPLLDGVTLLVIDALRDRPHPTHFTVAQALAAIERIRPERAYLTHICHELSHAEASRRLPRHVALAYDGLSLDFELGA